MQNSIGMKFKILYLKTIAFFIITSTFLSSCSDEINRGLKPIPNSFGELNQIIVLADDGIWESAVGDTLRYQFSGPFPILPQPEPLFDLTHFTPYELAGEPPRRELRTYLIVADLSDEESPTSKLVIQDIGVENTRKAKSDPTFNSTVGRDKWAKGQQLIYLFGYDKESLIDNLKNNFGVIAQRVKNADQKKIEQTVFQSGNDINIMEKIKSNLGIDIRIPSDYFEAINQEDFAWLRMETEKISSNIIIQRIPYTDQSQLSKSGIKSIRDTIGRKYISTDIEGTYMKINDLDLPMYTSTKTINGNYALEARGIWEIENDYMGGAFISYLIHNSDNDELVFLDGFVYAPGKSKRNFIQYLEYILGTTRF